MRCIAGVVMKLLQLCYLPMGDNCCSCKLDVQAYELRWRMVNAGYTPMKAAHRFMRPVKEMRAGFALDSSAAMSQGPLTTRSGVSSHFSSFSPRKSSASVPSSPGPHVSSTRQILQLYSGFVTARSSHQSQHRQQPEDEDIDGIVTALKGIHTTAHAAPV